MKIGFFIKWPIMEYYHNGWIIGDAHYAQSMCNELAKIPGVDFARQYDCNTVPNTQLDIMIYMNDNEIRPELARKNVLYLQNGHNEGMDVALKRLRQLGYDGYIFISQKLLAVHESEGYKGIYLPFGVDLSLFNPKEKTAKYNYEVAYVGNDIKGSKRTMRYLYPALNYNFGLFGAWESGRLMYQELLSKISQGLIEYEELPLLYSNAKINLNFTFQDQVNWGAMTDRPFQIMACKGFVISDYISEVESELNSCMIITKGGLDTINKIDYYLSRPKERTEIAENGYQYVQKYANIQARVKQLYNYLREII